MAQDRKHDNRPEGSMTLEEAGRKGGEATKARHGPEFYSRIGKIGGQARAGDPDVRSGELGRKGGEATRRRHGPEFYSLIGRKGGEARAGDEDVRSGALGRKGGEATKLKHGPEFYSEIGRKGGHARAADSAAHIRKDKSLPVDDIERPEPARTDEI